MRAAPPVDALLAHGRKERLVIVVLYALSVAAAGHWAWVHAGLAWLPVVPTLALGSGVGAGVGALVAHRLLPLPAQHLRWTGSEWQLDGQVVTGLVVQVDAGRWLLLKAMVGNQHDRWLVADASHAGGAWHGLRLALQAHSPGLA